MTTAHFVSFRTAGLTDSESGIQLTLGPAHGDFLRNAMQLHYRLENAPLDPERIRWRRTVHERIWQSPTLRDPMLTGGQDFSVFWSLGPGFDDNPPEGLGFDALPRSLYDIDTPGLLSGHARQIEVTDRVALDQTRARRRATSDAHSMQIVFKRNFIQWIEVQAESGWTRISNRFRWCDLLQVRWTGAQWKAGPLCRIAGGQQSMHDAW
jgi:hypothetical protein